MSTSAICGARSIVALTAPCCRRCAGSATGSAMPQTRRSLRTWGSVRLQLTAWYVLLLGLTLVLFSFYLHLRLEPSLGAQMDDALQVAASQALGLVSEDPGHPTFGTTDATQTVLRRLTQAGFAGRLTAPDGTVWDGFGDAQSVPAGPPPVLGWSSLEVKDTEWRGYSQPLGAPEGRPRGWVPGARPPGPTEQTPRRQVRQRAPA